MKFLLFVFVIAFVEQYATGAIDFKPEECKVVTDYVTCNGSVNHQAVSLPTQFQINHCHKGTAKNMTCYEVKRIRNCAKCSVITNSPQCALLKYGKCVQYAAEPQQELHYCNDVQYGNSTHESESQLQRSCKAPGGQNGTTGGQNGTTAAPSGQNGSSAAPSHNNGTSAAPTGNNATSAAPSSNNATSAAPSGNNATSAAPNGNNATSAAPSSNNATSAAPSSNNATTAAPSVSNGTTAAPSGSNGTTAASSVGSGSTAPPSGNNATSAAPSSSNATSAAPSGNNNSSTAAPSGNNATSAAPSGNNNGTTAAPSGNNSTSGSSSGNNGTSAAPSGNNATTLNQAQTTAAPVQTTPKDIGGGCHIKKDADKCSGVANSTTATPKQTRTVKCSIVETNGTRCVERVQERNCTTCSVLANKPSCAFMKYGICQQYSSEPKYSLVYCDDLFYDFETKSEKKIACGGSGSSS